MAGRGGGSSFIGLVGEIVGGDGKISRDHLILCC